MPTLECSLCAGFCNYKLGLLNLLVKSIFYACHLTSYLGNPLINSSRKLLKERCPKRRSKSLLLQTKPYHLLSSEALNSNKSNKSAQKPSSQQRGALTLLSGGCLLAFVPVWARDVMDLWVQSVISKYKMNFLSLLPPHFMPSNMPASIQNKADLMTALHQVQSQGVVVSVPLEWFQGCYSILLTAS